MGEQQSVPQCMPLLRTLTPSTPRCDATPAEIPALTLEDGLNAKHT